MIGFIDDELRQWAAWSIARRDGGLGYPRQINFARLGSGACSSFAPIIDEDAVAMEQCVLRLPESLWCVVDYWYRAPSANPTLCALYCNCHRDTVYARLNQAHVQLMGWLNDLAADIALPAPRKPNKTGAHAKKRLTPTPTV